VNNAALQADGILTARIAQVVAGANTTVATALGGLGALERQLVNDENKLITTVDEKLTA